MKQPDGFIDLYVQSVLLFRYHAVPLTRSYPSTGQQKK
jgi:hypothetical protein